jgi:acetate kinase
MNSVLTLNAGSTSLRFGLFAVGGERTGLLRGSLERIGLPGSFLSISARPGFPAVQRNLAVADHAACVPPMLEALELALDGRIPMAVAHRIVHGGPRFFAPRVLDVPTRVELKRLIPFAPGHLPAEIALIEAVAEHYPGVLQIACFDTDFHRSLPPVAALLPIPRRFHAMGIRRYGFHGISYTGLMQELVRRGEPTAVRGAVILAHLGGGSSLAAVRDGVGIDTSMGFTPASGLPMGTRSGDLDPGLPGFLARTEGMTAAGFDRMVHEESGLLGLSGTGSDLRDLLVLEPTDPHAREAVDLFCYQTRKWIGAFAAALGGLDTLVFTGGIGEHCPTVRGRICEGLAFLGVTLDPVRNAANAGVLSKPTSPVRVLRIPADEERTLAHLSLDFLELHGSPAGFSKPTGFQEFQTRPSRPAAAPAATPILS